MADAGPVTPSRVAAAVQATGKLLGTAGSLAAVERISAELNGLGPLQVLTRDPAVTDIFVNAPDSVWLDRGNGLELTAVSFSSEGRGPRPGVPARGGRRAAPGRRFAVRGRQARRRLPDPCRPPADFHGRDPSERPNPPARGIHAWTSCGTAACSAAWSRTCWNAWFHRRLSFLISGATGSGKTTLLSTLLGLCHPGERLVLIEDASELNPVHPHVVSLESRHGNLEGGGGVDLGELVRQALRMRPDRLVVGECRGAEVRELLTAMNTGHTGGGGTIHANTAAAVPARLTALGALAGMGQDAVRLQVASALDVVVHVERSRAGRHVACIGVVEDRPHGLEVSAAVTVQAGTLSLGPAWPALARRLGLDDTGPADGEAGPAVGGTGLALGGTELRRPRPGAGT